MGLGCEERPIGCHLKLVNIPNMRKYGKEWAPYVVVHEVASEACKTGWNISEDGANQTTSCLTGSKQERFQNRSINVRAIRLAGDGTDPGGRRAYLELAQRRKVCVGCVPHDCQRCPAPPAASACTGSLETSGRGLRHWLEGYSVREVFEVMNPCISQQSLSVHRKQSLQQGLQGMFC